MDFDIKEQTILLIVAGSRAYGIHKPDSDVDVKGVLTVPSRYIFGFRDRFAQVDSPEHMRVWLNHLTPDQQRAVAGDKIEGSIYELRKFLSLAADCNPNILDVLFSRDEEVIHQTKSGQLLRENRDLFISSKAKFTFSGYAHSQLKRIKGHRAWLLDPPTHQPTREEFGLAEGNTEERKKFDVVAAAIRKKMDEWSWDFGDLPKSEVQRIEEDIALHLTEIGVVDTDLWNHAAASLGIPGDVVRHLAGEKKYLDAKRQWKQYENWKRQRNPARAELEKKHGYDTKHGAHLVRLLRMGKEILTTGKVNVWRGGIDAEELLAIRGGSWPYEKLVEWAEQQDQELTTMYKAQDYVVPHNPDWSALDVLCEELLEAAQYERV